LFNYFCCLEKKFDTYKLSAYRYNIFTGLLLFCLSICSFLSYSQNFERSLKSKLNRDDLRKILRSEKLMAKGYAIIGNDPFVPDTGKSNNYSFYIPQNHQIAAYYMSHIDASLNFKFAIELKYEVLSKNIAAFWNEYKGDKKSVEWIKSVENSSFDSLLKADQVRQDADKKVRLVDKIPLLKKAERIEENAEFLMEKIVFICQNLPLDPLPEWLASDDTMSPLKHGPIAKTTIPKSNLQDKSLNESLVKDTSLYNLLHITEQQVDLFNDFLLQKFPNQVENYVLNYEQMTHIKIDSLQEEWNSFELGQFVTSDSSFANAITKKNSPVQAVARVVQDAKNKRQLVNKSSEQAISTSSKGNNETNNSTVDKSLVVTISSSDKNDSFYRVQIAACRDELSPWEIKHRWKQPESVVVTYENDWYKYSIGSFSDYHDAHELRTSCGVKGAFVVAYLNGKRIQVTPYLINKKHPK
jgi:hypothetical protein